MLTFLICGTRARQSPAYLDCVIMCMLSNVRLDRFPQTAISVFIGSEKWSRLNGIYHHYWPAGKALYDPRAGLNDKNYVYWILNNLRVVLYTDPCFNHKPVIWFGVHGVNFLDCTSSLELWTIWPTCNCYHHFFLNSCHHWKMSNAA